MELDHHSPTSPTAVASKSSSCRCAWQSRPAEVRGGTAELLQLPGLLRAALPLAERPAAPGGEGGGWRLWQGMRRKACASGVLCSNKREAKL